MITLTPPEHRAIGRADPNQRHAPPDDRRLRYRGRRRIRPTAKRVRRAQGRVYRRRSWLRLLGETFAYFVGGMASGAALLGLMYLAAVELSR